MKHPFYCRSCILLESKDWLSLRNPFYALKSKWGIPKEFEFKWQMIWLRKVMSQDAFDTKFPEISGLSEAHMLGFVNDCMLSLAGMSSSKLIFTVTNNEYDISCDEITLWKMHVEDIMQRVQYSIQDSKENIAVIFLDNISVSADEAIKEKCYDLIRNDKLTNYPNVKDSVYIEYSHHSYAMQLADYCAGIFNGMLREFDASISLFKIISGCIRKKDSGEIMGYGVCEVPTDKTKTVRLKIQGLIDSAMTRTLE